MDQATLVEHEIVDATRLVDLLKQDNFDVKAAFWLYTSEADQWFLYIASDVVKQKGGIEAYKAVFRTMRQMPDLLIDRFQVKLVAPDKPVAKAIIDFQSKRPARLPTRIRATNLGEAYIEDAYIYNI
jgi:hypothetical protein